jgi:hypothetical protein
VADNRVIIEKADGSQASVIEAEFQQHYPDVAYKVLGEETDASFEPVGIPKQRAPRRAPRPKVAKAKRQAAIKGPMTGVEAPADGTPAEITSE